MLNNSENSLRSLPTTSLRTVAIVDMTTKLMNVLLDKQSVISVRRVDTGVEYVKHLNTTVNS